MKNPSIFKEFWPQTIFSSFFSHYLLWAPKKTKQNKKTSEKYLFNKNWFYSWGLVLPSTISWLHMASIQVGHPSKAGLT
jgi:hypothetical protein